MEALGPEEPRAAGGYRLLSRLGEGGMGRVYLARSEGGRTVAVKLVHPELARHPEFRRRFQREVAAARRVSGRWTAPVLDADPDAAAPWVATGYVAGPSLNEVVTGSNGPLPVRSLYALANGLTRALCDVHAAGLVHRDLKPANVLVTIDGPRVIDFGIARALETAPGTDLTRTGVTVGSPGFMSPEQIRGEPLTTASDVFSLGTVLAFAATGRSPFGDAAVGVPGLLVRIVQDEKDLAGIPEGVRDLVQDCLAPEPGGRPGLEQLLERTAVGDLWDPGPGDEPWLPGPLVARLGRHAVELLDSEAPPDDRPTAPAQEPDRPTTVLDASRTPPRPVPGPGASGPVGPAGLRPRSRRVAWILAACATVAAILLGIGVWYAVDPGRDNDDGKQAGPRDPARSTAPAGDEVTDGGSPPAGEAAITARDVAGTWEGEAQRAGDSAVTFHRFELADGEVGDTIGTVHAVLPNALCAGEVTLAAVEEDHLTITTDRLYDVPEGACTYTGRSTLSISGSTLVWRDTGLTAALEAATDGGEPDAVPGDYLGEWRFRDSAGQQHTLALSQGGVTEPLLIWTRQGTDGSRCTGKHRLLAVAAAQDWLLFAHGEATGSQPSEVCKDADIAAFRFHAPEGTTEATVQMLQDGHGTWQLHPAT